MSAILNSLPLVGVSVSENIYYYTFSRSSAVWWIFNMREKDNLEIKAWWTSMLTGYSIKMKISIPIIMEPTMRPKATPREIWLIKYRPSP